jgi:hypothetical protein
MTTSAKILPIIASSPEADEPAPVGNAARAGELMAMMEKGTNAALSAFADWVDLAVQITQRDGSSQVGRRLDYPAVQNAQLWSNMLYGNRSPFKIANPSDEPKNWTLALDKHGQPIYLDPTADQMKDQNIRFSAKENLGYWEARLSNYTTDQNGQLVHRTEKDGQVITTAINEDDMAYADTVIAHGEALRWFAFCKAQYDTAVAFVEALRGQHYVYVPFQRTAAAAPRATNAVALAASLRRK